MHFDERVVTGEMTRAEYLSNIGRRAALARHGNRTTAERFWSHVAKSDGCWEWTGTRPHNKYGRFRIGETFVMSHRYSWTITNGAIPEGQCVCHRCDNMKCVRPDHLFLGTHTDNMRDAQGKGRLRGRYSKPK